MANETLIGGQGRDFPETRWTLIVSSKEASDKRQAALSELLNTYWKPLYYYVRRKGRTIEASKDMIQGFFVHLLQQDFLARLDPGKGRFRSYLRTSLDHYMANLYESQSAQKRGGRAKNVSLDFDLAEDGLAKAPDGADSAYDREWALGVMERAMAQLRSEFQDGKRQGPFDIALKFFQFTGTPPTYEEAAKQSGMTMTQFKAFLHRARTRFREIVKQEISHTVASDGDAESELTELMKALRS